MAEDPGHTEAQVLAKQFHYEGELANHYVDHPGYLAYYAAAVLVQSYVPASRARRLQQVHSAPSHWETMV